MNDEYPELVLVLEGRPYNPRLDAALQSFRRRGWRVEYDGTNLRVAARYGKPLDTRVVLNKVRAFVDVVSIVKETK